MIEITDLSPDVNVHLDEYQRLLGYPKGYVMEGRAAELAASSRAWYAEHGRPWIYARQAVRLDYGPGKVCIDGIAFHSTRLAETLEQAEATSAILVAVSAGPELEAEADRLWRAEKPDEYFFLESYGSAVVEHLTTVAGARLCAWADPQQLAVLPHYSPGYPEWDISEQAALFSLLKGMPGHIEVLESGALRPKKSLLAVFGVTPHLDHARQLANLVPCESCSFAPCQYRRAPYSRADVTYGVNTKALRRWASERLSLEKRDDGSINALFRYDGTTCTNEGRPLAFDYHVTLGPAISGYPIREQRCEPAPGDTGHTYMCRYIDSRDQLMSAIEHESPLLGRRLNDVLGWQRPQSPAGCFCDAASREHKWGLVLETIHYALSRGVDSK